MHKFSKKQYLVAGVAALAIAGAAGGAYAYWTTTGSGSGTGTAASSNGTLVLHASFASDSLTPGGSVPVSFTADNGGSSNLQVGTVHTVVTASGSCDASYMSVADAVENQTIGAHTSGVALTAGSVLVYADSTTVNQDSCKGATITLTLSS
jgi:hypothetical protein